jgi:hypothetical protein
MNTKKLFPALFLVLIIAVSVIAQEPQLGWSKIIRPAGYGGVIVPITMGYDVHQLPDGGYIAAGITNNPGAMAFIARTNAQGDTLWTKQYFSVETFYGIHGTDVERTNNGDYYVSGFGTREMTSGIWLLKLNQSGDTIWTRYFTLYGDTVFVTRDMKITPDGGVIITGVVKDNLLLPANIFVLKYNSNGIFQWFTRVMELTIEEQAYSIENAFDGGYIVASTYDPLARSSLRLTKFGDNGQILWSSFFEGTADSDLDLPYIIRTSDNHYVISGQDLSSYFLMKVNTAREMVWYHTYGAVDESRQCFGVAQTKDGGYVLTGTNQPVETSYTSIYVIKTNLNGEEVSWTKMVNIYNTDCPNFRIRQTSDDGYIIVGGTRLDPDGAEYMLLVKLGGTSDVSEMQGNEGISLYQNQPNPFSDNTTIQFSIPRECFVSIKIFDVTGVEVASPVNGQIQPGIHQVELNRNNLGNGIYYYRLEAEGYATVKRMIIIR